MDQTGEWSDQIAVDEATFVFITDRWGFTKGGINVFNTELCFAIARLFKGRRSRVFCAVEAANAYEQSHATGCGVELIVLSNSCADEKMAEHRAHELVALTHEKNGKTADWWIGHDIVSGALARRAADLCSGSHCAIFHHMDYEAYKGLSGESLRTRNKITEQRKVLTSADLVFGVGPKLTRSAREKTSVKNDLKIVQIIPGLSNIEGRPRPSNFSAITFGRLTRDTDLIKQASLAVAAFASAVDLRHAPLGTDARLTVIGLSADSADDEHKALLKLAGENANRAIPINAFPYDENRLSIMDELPRHSVCLMLSLHEGFGLTGWEAIAAEVPLIVSKNSGLFELVGELLGGSGTGCLESVDIRGKIGTQPFQDDDIQVVVSALARIASRPDDAKANALALKKLLRQNCTWENAAIAVVRALATSYSPRSGSGDREEINVDVTKSSSYLENTCSASSIVGIVTPPHRLQISDRRLTCCVWLNNDQTVVTGGFAGKLFIIEKLSENNIHTIFIGDSIVRCIQPIPDTKLVLVGDDSGRIALVETNTGSVHEIARTRTSVFSISLGVKRNLMYTSEREGAVVEWQLETDGKRARKLRVIHRHAGTAFAAHFDEYTQICWSVGSDGVLNGSRFDAGTPIIAKVSTSALFSIALAGANLAIGNSNGILYTGTTASLSIDSREGHIDAIRKVSFSTSGAWVATAGKDGTLRLWHVASGRSWILTKSHDYLYDVVFSRSNSSLVACDGAGDLAVIYFGRPIDDFSAAAMDSWHLSVAE